MNRNVLLPSVIVLLFAIISFAYQSFYRPESNLTVMLTTPESLPSLTISNLAITAEHKVRTVADLLAMTDDRNEVAVFVTVTAQAIEIDNALVDAGLIQPTVVAVLPIPDTPTPTAAPEIATVSTSTPTPPVDANATARDMPETQSAPEVLYNQQPPDESPPIGGQGPLGELALLPHFEASLWAHNVVRAEVSVSPLTWNEGLAQASQVWADAMAAQGFLQHDPNLNGGWENISQQPTGTDADQIVTNPLFGWASTLERDTYVETGGCPYTSEKFGYCGHYKNITDPELTRLGCGMTSNGEWDFWVCRFGQ